MFTNVNGKCPKHISWSRYLQISLMSNYNKKKKVWCQTFWCMLAIWDINSRELRSQYIFLFFFYFYNCDMTNDSL